MKDQTKASQLMESLLEEVVTSVKSVKDLTSEHAPDIAKEVVADETVRLNYELAKSWIFLLFALGALSIAALSGYEAVTYVGKDRYDDPIGYIIIAVILGIIGGVGTCASVDQLIDTKSNIARLKVAPKKEVLDYLRRLLR